MDSNWNTKQERQALKRMIALLCALAALAEHASAAPAAIRFMVLWILRPGEAIARDYTIATAEDFGCLADLPEPILGQQDDGPADTLRLAVRFRALAAVLDTLSGYLCLAAASERHRGCAAQEARHGHPAAVLRGAIRDLPQTLRGLPAWTQPAPDTS